MITRVAVKHRGTVYSLPPPNRHHHVIVFIVLDVGALAEDNEQGFLDDEGRFLDRVAALEHALACNQVKDPTKIRADRLFSEDLW